MPSPQTAYDLIKGAMRLIGAIAVGETPSADEANDGLSSLNDLLELMSTDNLMVYGSANDTFMTIPGQAVYTVGVGGNWNTDRPVRIGDVAYCSVSGTDFEVLQWSQDDYNGVALKTQQQDIIERFLYVNDNPLGLLTLFPVPRSAVQITFSIDRVLASVPSLATVLSYPPGYQLYMKHALAIMLASEYGQPVPDAVNSIFKAAKAAVARANKPKRYSTYDSMLVAEGPALWQRGY